MRRVRAGQDGGENLYALLKERNLHVLPNTAGCKTVEEALLVARLSRSLGLPNWIKLEVIPDPSPGEGLFDRSDNVAFAAKGIPAPTFSPGFRAFSDPGVANYYHQVADEADEHFDFSYLKTFAQAYVRTARLVADYLKHLKPHPGLGAEPGDGGVGTRDDRGAAQRGQPEDPGSHHAVAGCVGSAGAGRSGTRMVQGCQIWNLFPLGRVFCTSFW